MKQLYIVANWKENKTSQQALVWLEQLTGGLSVVSGKVVIVCPPFSLLSETQKYIAKNQLPVKLGAQDVSQFAQGAHTGEMSAVMVKEFAQYVIIGHSERRETGDTETVLREKVKNAHNAGLDIIYCVSSLEQPIPTEIKIIAFEPLNAISTGSVGQPDDPHNAAATIHLFKQKYPFLQSGLYGGSVTAENVLAFVQEENIDGVLVGGASLEAASFSAIIQQASVA